MRENSLPRLEDEVLAYFECLLVRYSSSGREYHFVPIDRGLLGVSGNLANYMATNLRFVSKSVVLFACCVTGAFQGGPRCRHQCSSYETDEKIECFRQFYSVISVTSIRVARKKSTTTVSPVTPSEVGTFVPTGHRNVLSLHQSAPLRTWVEPGRSALQMQDRNTSIFLLGGDFGITLRRKERRHQI